MPINRVKVTPCLANISLILSDRDSALLSIVVPPATILPVMDPNTILKTRAIIEQLGAGSLIVDDLTHADLPHIEWAGDGLHVKYVTKALERVTRGEVKYLAVRDPSGYPVCIGAIDFTTKNNIGTIWQLATHPELRSLGLGSRLIAEAELYIKQHRLNFAELGVEADNPRAQALYARLGYQPSGKEQESWDEMDEHGHTVTHHAEVILMRKVMGQ